VTDPKTPKLVDWLPYWDRRGDKTSKANYIADELQRIIAEGEPPLSAILTRPLPDQQDMALAVLRSRQPVVYLRLHSDAKPPTVDPYGRPLPDTKRGVFVTKVGTRGAGPGSSDQEGAMWTGTMRHAKNRPGNTRDPLYDTVEIGNTPTAMPVDQAVTVMRQWGFGIRPDRFKGKSQRDMWLVVECDAQGRAIGYAEPEKPAQQPQPQHHQRGR
jgi:hypothetical protein